MITLVVMTDGRRSCLLRAVESFDKLSGPISVRLIHDDSGDADYLAWLHSTFPDFLIYATGRRSGFDGAMRSVRSWLSEHDRNEYVFHTEDDFVFTREIPLRAMAQTLDINPNLAQLALRRQPWNQAEKNAGGIVEQCPQDYEDVSDLSGDWLRHRKFFTTNPSLIPRRFIKSPEWPAGKDSEGHFGISLFSDPEVCAGFWGARDSGEWVEHIGATRVGTGY